MRIDDQGHIELTPKEMHAEAIGRPLRLINDVLLNGTPALFATYSTYCDFLCAASERTGIHPRNLVVRGSCKHGYSIKPDVERIWRKVSDESDLDLAIVDVEYYRRIDAELQAWEATNRAGYSAGDLPREYVDRQRDRFFNCCRDYRLPPAVCVHHQDTMTALSDLVERICGRKRHVSAFIFRDWWSVRQRYEYDLRELCRGVSRGSLTPPPDEPLPS